MANNNKFNYKIPGIIIFIAFISCWPVGVILLILNSIGASNRKTEEKAQTYTRSYDSGVSVENKPRKRKKSALQSVLTGLAVADISLAVLSLLSLAADGFAPPSLSFLILFVFGLVFSFLAGLVKKRDDRYSKLRAIIGNNKSINLTKLAMASGTKLKKIRRDVQKLIDNGEFGETAYIDLATNNLMLSSDAEPDDPEAFDYRTVYGDILSKELSKDKQRDKSVGDENNADGDVMGDDFEKIIREIRRLNDEIEDVSVSEKIFRIEELTKNIFEYVRSNPNAMPQIRTFMNYYLPTTLKLLESYSRIERVGVAGENMKKSKESIEKTLDLLCIGFEQQVDQLFRNESIDISSDISVLEKMMQKDGLDGRNDFDISSFEKKSEAEDGFTDEISDELGGSGAIGMKKKD